MRQSTEFDDKHLAQILAKLHPCNIPAILRAIAENIPDSEIHDGALKLLVQFSGAPAITADALKSLGELLAECNQYTYAFVEESSGELEHLSSDEFDRLQAALGFDPGFSSAVEYPFLDPLEGFMLGRNVKDRAHYLAHISTRQAEGHTAERVTPEAGVQPVAWWREALADRWTLPAAACAALLLWTICSDDWPLWRVLLSLALSGGIGGLAFAVGRRTARTGSDVWKRV